LLDLAQKAVFLYEKQEMKEKRKLLDFVCSNSTWKDGRLIPQYRKPFDLLLLRIGPTNKQRPLPLRKVAFVQTGSPGRTRTSDQVVNSHSLCRLSYRGTNISRQL
jgi:hypothetical protein